jgi:dTDP-glucose pyrophosphorylase
MQYTSIILAAGNNSRFSELQLAKSRNEFIVSDEPRRPLVNFAIETYQSASQTILAIEVNNLNLVDSYPWLQEVVVHGRPHGALATLALTLDKVPNSAPILVSPVDGIFFKSKEFVESMSENEADVGIVAFTSFNPKYSYLRMKSDQIIEIAEKRVIGNFAASGAVYFRNLELLKECINWSLLNNVTSSNMLYLLPALNYFIARHQKLKLFQILESDYYRFSSPEEALSAKTRLESWING